MRALIAVTALPVLMFALAHGGRAAGPHTRTSEPFAGGPALAGRRLQGEDLPAPAPPGEGRQGEPLDHGARLRSRGGQGADLVRLRRDAARRGRVRQAGQVATTAQRARPDAPPASPRRLFGESRTPTQQRRLCPRRFESAGRRIHPKAERLERLDAEEGSASAQEQGRHRSRPLAQLDAHRAGAKVSRRPVRE